MREAAITSNSYLFPAVSPATATTVLPGFAAPMVRRSVGRYWRTLRHLRLSQLVFLGLHRILKNNDISRWPEASVGLGTPGGLRHMAEWQPELARQVIKAGDVRFVGTSTQVVEEELWCSKEVLRRQIFHANYCDFLNIDLTSAEDVDLLRQATRIALRWCDQNATGCEVGWQPFSLSIRIVNWLKFLVRNWIRAQELGDGEQVGRMLSSLRMQVLSLESRLEKELLANHLLKNAKALIFAGALLEAPESGRWRRLGQQILKEQIAEQILPDGGHIERSPMYHAWVLDDLLDIRQLFALCPPEDTQCISSLSDGIARMTRYLGAIVHPDGEIPLLNDSQLDVTRSTGKILADGGACEWIIPQSGPEVRLLPDTGYATIRDHDSRSFVIFDCGPLGPDYQPGHGHSDVLTYELTLHGQRVVVDTGVSSYEPGPERQYERSTAAHNTIRIDGVDQAEVWGSFRVGTRPKVSRIAQGEISGGQFLRGQHFGYKQVRVNHARAVARLTDNSWIFADLIEGNGRHKIESFIHFHPSVQVSPYHEIRAGLSESMTPRWSLQFGEAHYVLMTRGAGEVSLTSAWYSPGFAIRSPQAVIHWTHEGAIPITMVYAIVPEGTSSFGLDKAADQLTMELNDNSQALPIRERKWPNVRALPNRVSTTR
jgi:uncharacterized heparinase superfamily protein